MPAYGSNRSAYPILHTGMGFYAKKVRTLEKLPLRSRSSNPFWALAEMLSSDYIAAQIWEKL